MHLVIKHCLRAITCSLTSAEFPWDPSHNIQLITICSRVKRCRDAEGEDANESRNDAGMDPPTHTESEHESPEIRCDEYTPMC